MSADKKKLTPLLVTIENKQLSERLTIPLILLFGLTVSLFFYIIRGEAFMVIIIGWIPFIILLPLLFFIFSPKNEIAIYEEGIYTKGIFFGGTLHSWNSFRYFTVDKMNNQFKIKLENFGSILLISRKHFDEVKKILSERITPKQEQSETK